MSANLQVFDLKHALYMLHTSVCKMDDGKVYNLQI